MIVKLIAAKDNETWNDYKILLRCKAMKELNCKELCHLSW